MKRSLTLTVFGLFLLAAAAAVTMLVARAAPEPALVIDWETQLPGTLVSGSSPLGGVAPRLVFSPDGSRLLVGYLHYQTGPNDRRPYFSLSTNNGSSWTPAQPIQNAAGVDARGVAVGFTADNVAHAAWIGFEGGGSYKLFYGRDHNTWPTASPRVLSAVSGSPLPMTDPTMTTAGNVIDLVWAEPPSTGGNANIRHVRSSDGGLNWPAPATIAATLPTSAFPSIAIDQTGRLNVVWQENKKIYFAQGTAVGGSVTWSGPIVLSTNISDARKPSIVADGNTLHIAFTSWDGSDPNQTEQYIYYTQCGGGCPTAVNWTTAENISGVRADVNSNAPFFVSSTMTMGSGCLFVYFESVDPFAGLPFSETEAILGVNSCSGWAAGGREEVTARVFDPPPPGDPVHPRSVRPSVDIDGKWMHLTYERVVESNAPQIYHLRGQVESKVFMPVVRRK